MRGKYKIEDIIHSDDFNKNVSNRDKIPYDGYLVRFVGFWPWHKLEKFKLF